MKLGIIIPALNEEKKIATTISKIPNNIKGIEKTKILVVDDGSTDSTRANALQAGAEVISHRQNKGVGVAFQTGLEWALEQRVDVLVNIDADGQFNPDDIPTIIQPVLDGETDVVVANRFNNGIPEDMPKGKYVGNKMMSYLISKLSGLKLDDVSSGFRAFNKESMYRLNLIGNFTYTQESILDLATKGLKIVNVPVQVTYYKSRKSRVASNLLSYAIKTSMIIFRSFRDYSPLKFFGLIGLLIFLLGAILDTFTLIHYFQTGGFSPYISVIMAGIYLNTLGLGIIVLGVIADMFDRVRRNQENILYLLKKDQYED